jgi:hypothetical protein
MKPTIKPPENSQVSKLPCHIMRTSATSGHAEKGVLASEGGASLVCILLQS